MLKNKLIGYCSVIFLFITGLQLKAQSYIILPNDTVYAEAVPDQLTIFDIYMDNSTGTDTIILHWERLSLDIPVEWDYSLCDLGTCYPGIPLEGVMYPVAPGEQGFLGYNVFPLVTSGSTTLVMRVWEESAPAEVDTLVWIVSSEFPNSIESKPADAVQMYPTIASDLIVVENSLSMDIHLEIYDLNGHLLHTEKLTGGSNMINISALPSGSYISAIKSVGAIIKTQPLIRK